MLEQWRRGSFDAEQKGSSDLEAFHERALQFDALVLAIKTTADHAIEVVA